MISVLAMHYTVDKFIYESKISSLQNSKIVRGFNKSQPPHTQQQTLLANSLDRY